MSAPNASIGHELGSIVEDLLRKIDPAQVRTTVEHVVNSVVDSFVGKIDFAGLLDGVLTGSTSTPTPVPAGTAAMAPLDTPPPADSAPAATLPADSKPADQAPQTGFAVALPAEPKP